VEAANEGEAAKYKAARMRKTRDIESIKNGGYDSGKSNESLVGRFSSRVQ
jgi:hypothetical protein